jgi:nitroreductase
MQPWAFMVGFRGDVVYANIYSTLVEFNQLWAKTAPVLFLAISRKLTPNGDINKSSSYDLGQSVAMLSVQATAEGLYVHQMGGFNAEKAAALLNVPEEFEVRVAIALGYLGNPEDLPSNLKSMEYSSRSRKPLGEMVFTGDFGNPAEFI